MSRRTLRLAPLLLCTVLIANPTAAVVPDERALNVWMETVTERFESAMARLQGRDRYSYTMLAGDVGLTAAAISKIRNHHTPMSLEVGELLAKRLDVPLDWLMAFDVLKAEFAGATQKDVRAAARAQKGWTFRTILFALSAQVTPHDCAAMLDATATADLVHALERRGLSPALADLVKTSLGL